MSVSLRFTFCLMPIVLLCLYKTDTSRCNMVELPVDEFILIINRGQHVTRVITNRVKLPLAG